MSGLFIVYGKPSLYAVALAAWHAVGVGGGCPRSSSGTAKVYYMYIQVQYYLVYFSPLLLADCGRIELLVLFKDTGTSLEGPDANGATHTHAERGPGPSKTRTSAQTPTLSRTEARTHPGRTRNNRPGPHTAQNKPRDPSNRKSPEEPQATSSSINKTQTIDFMILRVRFISSTWYHIKL